MVPEEWLRSAIDPVEIINREVEEVWNEIRTVYDVTGSVPELHDLFLGVDLAKTEPESAAEALVVSMLEEVSERVGRFSPWYKKPARAYGLSSIYDKQANQVRWVLAPEARLQWEHIIECMAGLIGQYRGLIRALALMSELTENMGSDPCILVHCGCLPPLNIQLKKSIFERAHIICQECSQPFIEE